MALERRITITEGDITRLPVEAVVNAANRALLGGGGVDGAIHRAAGPELLEACRALGGCPTGEARITPGFRMSARWIIHTVGPVWRGGDADEDDLLTRCYRNALRLAAEHRVRTIAFPSISTGAYRFPLDRACRIALRTVGEALAASDLPEHVTFVAFGAEALAAHRAAWAALNGGAVP
jgi:O-acetyl-ADP-ribose deacetylase (regulator of RNase III)